MHWNNRWQAPLCAALLLSFIACKDSAPEAKDIEIQEATLSKISPAAENNKADAAAAAEYEKMGDTYKAEEARQTNDKEYFKPNNEGSQQAGGLANNKQVADRQQAPQQHPTPPRTDPATPSQTPAANPDWDKKIIKTGTLSVEVKNYTSFNETVHNIVKQSGGYIAKEEQNQSDYKQENEVTIKVPVDQFDNLMSSLSPNQEKILVKRISSQDVTGEVVDTRSRLEAKRAMRMRYLDLLKQAKNMEEILQVQNEINSLQEQMESAAGRINYLSHSSAYSTIQLTYYQVLNPLAKDNNTPPGYGTRILAALGEGMSWLGEVLVVILMLWPLWIILGAAWIAWRKHLVAKPAVVVQAPPTPANNSNNS